MDDRRESGSLDPSATRAPCLDLVSDDLAPTFGKESRGRKEATFVSSSSLSEVKGWIWEHVFVLPEP